MAPERLQQFQIEAEWPMGMQPADNMEFGNSLGFCIFYFLQDIGNTLFVCSFFPFQFAVSTEPALVDADVGGIDVVIDIVKDSGAIRCQVYFVGNLSQGKEVSFLVKKVRPPCSR